jgi:catechol 2,3-dioxygenase-like lactoylglutathione lyase family enzyme
MSDAKAPIVSPKAFSHISLKVTDIERSISYYESVFGYDVFLNGYAPTPDRSRHCIGLLAGATGIALELLQIPGKAELPGPNTLGLVGISLTVQNVEAALDALKKSGHAKTERVIVAGDWRVAFVRDPDGNIIELVEQPHGATTIAGLAPHFRAKV